MTSTVLPPYSIRRSRRAKRISLRVVPDRGVECVIPYYASEKAAHDFVLASQDWLRRHANWVSPQAALTDSERFALPSKIALNAIPQVLTVCYLDQMVIRATPKLTLNKDLLCVYGKVENFKACVPALKRLLIQKAYEVLSPRLYALSQQTGFAYRVVSFRGQRTRWGSCSSDQRISLNYKLLFLNEDVVRYVMIHELCHLKEMNHSSRFWRLVKQYEPNYRALKNQLKQSENDLPAWI